MLPGLIKIFERRISRDVSRAGWRGENFKKDGKIEGKKDRKEVATGGRADPFVLRSDAGRGHERAFPLPDPPPTNASTQHRIRWSDTLRHRQRCGRRFWKNWRGRCRDRHGRRHGASLRRVRSRLGGFLSVDDD